MMSLIGQRKRNLLLGILGGALLGAALALGASGILDRKEEAQAPPVQSVVVARNTIPWGTTIAREDLGMELMETDRLPEGTAGVWETVAGRVALFDIPPGTILTEAMSSPWEKPPDGLRLHEYESFLLPWKLGVADRVDVRIQFPTGEDFVVLTHKKVEDMDRENNRIWMVLEEEELLRMSSALVDTLLGAGTRLYLVPYVEPKLQAPAAVDYPVNKKVLALLARNPGYGDQLAKELELLRRGQLEGNLAASDPELVRAVEQVLGVEPVPDRPLDPVDF
ncbi:SAF domain-containing protein [Anaerotalea alkaliphila]|uniref:SAF domain-containing protein n=1 Tax=Anaerotalea alkaliphila TaxID=2662126 RepID=A0A7X5KL22_9FIRM|nr:SAF domain-containing protein [Anaerotalea alkaliphila]NDL66376.1 hypothetical protein [Anaerotalea alkaliphila]